HGHMDAGSFILEAMGERWAIDAGKQDYNGLESKGMDIWSFKQNSDRWKVFRNSNLSHNTLTFNGQLQYVQGHSAIVSVVNKPNLRGAVAELSGVYPYAALGIKRGVALSGKEIAVVRDEIITRSGPEASMQWTMLTPASVKVTAPNRAELMLNGKKLFMAVTGSGDPKLVTWGTATGHEFDEPLTGCMFIGFKSTLPANKTAQFEVIFSTREITPMSNGLTPALKEWKP
ncbi:MAG: heparinase II/III family protein, partial [Bacteroidota bacterium]